MFVTSGVSEEGTFWVQVCGAETDVFDQLSERLQEESTQVEVLWL